MSTSEAHEIVIIKRHGGDHDDHHGGAWKIAFADFMTAMMALFLVLWLTSANEKTKATIARYFNPAQLVDSTPQPPGLEDPKPGTPSQASKAKTVPPAVTSDPADDKKDAPNPPANKPEAPKSDATKPESKASKGGDSEMLKDPYAVLAELSAKNSSPPKMTQKSPTDGARGGSGAVGIRGGEAYRDPFEPLAVSTEAPPPPFKPDAKPLLESALSPPQTSPSPDAQPQSLASAASPSAEQQAAAEALKARIAAAMKALDGAGPAAGEPRLEVKATAEGLLIGLTDDAGFTMFPNGSAKPAPKLVALMERIGRLLKTEKGAVTIRGFTDNKPYRTEAYDNWQLSASRAHMAHYMLVRGGLEEARVERIEGFADRRPKNTKDPGAPENRRIEILLRESAP